MQRAVDELITLLTKVCRPVSRRLFGHRTGRPVVEQFDSSISNVRENPRRSKSGFFWNDKQSRFSLFTSRDSKTRIPGRLRQQKYSKVE